MKTKTLEVREKRSQIILDCPISSIQDHLCTDKNVLITDENVSRYHGDSFPDIEVIELPPGEGSKKLMVVEGIYERLLELEMDRNSSVIGIGGGTVSDITGFVGSTYMRGMRFAFAPTTLLAQVDASIGGKNGVNFRGYKNMIGTINQPDFVLVDYDFLDTLPEKEIKNGMAEVIKSAAIGSAELFDHLEENTTEIRSLERHSVERMVSDSIDIKIDIVSRDELESGERRKLNFGHTFGHAIERNSSLSHGDAVAVGMVMAADMSVEMGMLGSDDAQRLRSLIDDFGLPVDTETYARHVKDSIKMDKKRQGDSINFVLLEAIGTAKVVPVPLKRFMDDHI